MTSPNPMSRDELLEWAPLDAFGLLDEYEASLFERSFHHAAASVQAEIRKLQADLAEDASLLSGEEPRSLLRQKVLVAVQEEIEAATEYTQPLAQIGLNQSTLNPTTIAQPAAALAGSAAGSGSVRSMLMAAGALEGVGASGGQDDAMRELVAEIRARAAAGVKDRATPYWRAASFFLAASLVVSLYFLASTVKTAEMIATAVQKEVINDQVRALVPDLSDFAYRDSQIRGLATMDSSINAAAVIIVDAKNNRACLLGFGLSECKGPFTLRAVDDQGNARVILNNIQASDPVSGHVAEALPSDVNMLACKIELLDGDGKVVLRTA
jgi:hypothetical protein